MRCRVALGIRRTVARGSQEVCAQRKNDGCKHVVSRREKEKENGDFYRSSFRVERPRAAVPFPDIPRDGIWTVGFPLGPGDSRLASGEVSAVHPGLPFGLLRPGAVRSPGSAECRSLTGVGKRQPRVQGREGSGSCEVTESSRGCRPRGNGGLNPSLWCWPRPVPRCDLRWPRLNLGGVILLLCI